MTDFASRRRPNGPDPFAPDTTAPLPAPPASPRGPLEREAPRYHLREDDGATAARAELFSPFAEDPRPRRALDDELDFTPPSDDVMENLTRRIAHAGEPALIHDPVFGSTLVPPHPRTLPLDVPDLHLSVRVPGPPDLSGERVPPEPRPSAVRPYAGVRGIGVQVGDQLIEPDLSELAPSAPTYNPPAEDRERQQRRENHWRWHRAAPAEAPLPSRSPVDDGIDDMRRRTPPP